MTDAIHNFHPQYQQYTQYSSDNKRFQGPQNNNHNISGSGSDLKSEDKDEVVLATPSVEDDSGPAVLVDINTGEGEQQNAVTKKGKQGEKSLLLTFDDEFQ